MESLSVDELLSADEVASSSPASTSESETQRRTVPSSSLHLPAWNSSNSLRSDAGFLLFGDEAEDDSDKDQGANDIWFAPATTATTLHRKRRMVGLGSGSRKSSLTDARRRRSLSPAGNRLDADKSVRQCVSAPELPMRADEGAPGEAVDRQSKSRIDNLLAELGWSREKANAVMSEAMDADSQEQEQGRQQAHGQQLQQSQSSGSAAKVPSGLTSTGALFQRRAHMREGSNMPSPSPVVIPGSKQPVEGKNGDEDDEDEAVEVMRDPQHQQPHSATLPFSSLSDTQRQRMLADLQASQISQQTANRLGVFNDFVTPSQQFSGQDASERAARAVQAALLYGMEGKGPNMSPGGQRRPSTASSGGSNSTTGMMTPITPLHPLAPAATRYHQHQQRLPSRSSSLSTPSSAFNALSMQDHAPPSASMGGPSFHQSQPFAYQVPSTSGPQTSLPFSSSAFSHFQQSAAFPDNFGAPQSAEETDFMTLGNSLGLSSVPRQAQAQMQPQQLQHHQQREEEKNPPVIDSSSYGHIFGGMPHVQHFQQLQLQQQLQQQQVASSPKKKTPSKTRSSPNLRTRPPAAGDASTPSRSPRRIASNRRLTLSSQGGSAVPPLPHLPKSPSSKAEKHLRRHSHASSVLTTASSGTADMAYPGGSSSAKSPSVALPQPGKFAFVNYGMEDAEELCSAVAPSGSYKVPLKGYGSSDEATPGAGEQEEGKSNKKPVVGGRRSRTRTKSHGSAKTGPRWEPVEEDLSSGDKQQPQPMQRFEPVPQQLQFQQLFFDVHGDEVGGEGADMGLDDGDEDDEEAQAQQNKVKRRKSVASLSKKSSRESVGTPGRPRRHTRTSTGA